MRNVGADGEVVDEVGAQDSSCGLASHEWWRCEGLKEFF